jgi:chromosome segregation ATPase
MRIRTNHIPLLVLLLSFIVGLSFAEANAQKRTKKRSVRRPVVTNPAIAEPGEEQISSSDAKVVSTADENGTASDQTESGSTRRTAARKKPQSDQMQDTINALSTQVGTLNETLTKMREEQKSMLDMERLTRAETRAESLRAQLREVLEKSSNLQARVEEIDYAVKPENIERSIAAYGTTRPEELRDARRRQLESERTRLQTQLATLENSRVRLELAISTADREVDMLRERLDKAMNSESTQPLPPPDTNTPTEPPPEKNPYPPQ